MKTRIHTVKKTTEGHPVPSVTTVLGILAKPALIHWAWKLGIEGQDYRKVRDHAADVGTLAHYMIQCDIKGEKPDTSQYSAENLSKAETSYLAWLHWAEQHQLRAVAAEERLVSEHWGYGGTIDYVASDPAGKLWLIDYKTGSGIYPEMRYQIAAYVKLWEEVKASEINEKVIVRLDRDTGEFEQHSLGDLDLAWSIFLGCLNLYRAIKADK